MRHPAEYWIKFLLSRRAHSFDEIAGMCEMAGIGGVTHDILQPLQDELTARMPIPFRPYDERHKLSQLFLRKEGLLDAWFRDDDMHAAIALLGNQRVRHLLESFILSPMRPHQIIRKIAAAVGEEITERCLELYRHYFWNPTLLSMADWSAFLSSSRMTHSEWLQLALHSQGPQGVQLLLWKTGTGALKHIEAGRIFTDIRNIAYMKIKEMEHQPASVPHSVAFKNYADSAKKAQEEVAASTGAVKDLVDTFQAFTMRHDTKAVTPVAELPGSYSEADDVAEHEERIRAEDY